MGRNIDMSNGGGRRNGAGRAIARVLCATAAIAAICFCAWSAYEYANGRDPLSFLGGPAFKTVADVPATTVDASDVSDASEEVSAALRELTFDGQDVSVAPEDCTVVVRGGCAWVENRDGGAADEMVFLTARRAASLAAWAHTANCGVTSVVWISEDHAGAVRMAIAVDAASAPVKGDAATILAAARGYAISADAYAAIGDAPAFGRTGGTTPVLPDDSAVPVPSKLSEAGERLSPEDAATAMGSLVTGSGGSSASAPSASASSAGSSESRSDVIVVTMTVDGTAAGAGSSTASVEVPRGATVYDALVASGVAFDARGSQFGTYVSSICGLSEKAHGGMSGWVYAVNGEQVNRACSGCTLSDGDRISWVYVNVTE